MESTLTTCLHDEFRFSVTNLRPPRSEYGVLILEVDPDDHDLSEYRC